MKSEKSSKIALGHLFLNSYSYKIWRIFNKIKKIINYSLFDISDKKSKKYEYQSVQWITNVIIPAKAFKKWVVLGERLSKVKAQIFRIGKKYMPGKFKVFLKRNLPGLLPVSIAPVPSEIKAEWRTWLESRTDQSLDIIDFCVISYEYRIQRPQHLARELTLLGNRVFYIENEFTYSSREKEPQIEIIKKQANLYAVKLASSKNYFIYSDNPSKKDKRIIIASLKHLMKEARIINPIAKIDHPFWASIADELGMPIVYDAMDFHAGFKENSQFTLDREKQLLVKSDLILSSSDYITHEFRNYKSKLITVKNAGEYKHFESAIKIGGKCPEELERVRGSIIGYYGALADWFDTEIIEKLATDLPQTTIVLIGFVNNSELERIAAKYSNVRLLGEKSYKVLPRYLAKFDVCLIPFKMTELIKATNPVKIFEYFAAGKPVVTTRIPELKPYSKVLYFADTPEQFSLEVSKALKEKSKNLVTERRKIASANTWSDRAVVINTKLLSTFYPRVSIIILIYNHANMSRVSIETTLGRTKYPNFEIIAVDNKSDEETIKMLERYKGTKNIKLIFNSENFGFAKGNNIGLKAANGEYLVLLNNDIRATPGWIERLVYHARSNPKAGLVGPVTNSIGNESKIKIAYDPENQSEIEYQAALYTYSHWGNVINLREIAAFAWLKPRNVYKKIGRLDERFGRGLFEDDDYCLRVKNAGYKILCAEDSFIHHYGGASTGWGTPEYQKLFNTNKELFEKKWNLQWTPHKYRK